jgi:hypothetical protein
MTPGFGAQCRPLPPQLALRARDNVAELAARRPAPPNSPAIQQILSRAKNFATGDISSVRWRFITVKITQRLPSAEPAEPADTR